MENIIDGKELSLKIKDEVKQSIKGCIIRPSIAVIDVGNNKLNEFVAKQKEDICNEVGIYFRYYKYEEDVPELTIINKIKELNNDDYVNGIMVQLPLPERYNEKRILNTIANSKDIDGLTDINIGRLISGRKTIVPTTALAIMTLLKEYNVSLEGKNVVLVGKGKLVGRPLIHLLLNEGATLTICHSKTIDLKEYTASADVLISATGKKNIITEDMIKDGAVVIDAGCNMENDKIYGDVDFDNASKKASLITPSKGGVGPMTIAMLLKNLVFCYNNKNK